MPADATVSEPVALQTMQCLEIWGGNGASENGVRMPGIDAWVLARPYRGDAEGGDIHYVSSCSTGRISRVMVADVSGHGNEVGTTATGLRSLMRRYVNYVDQGALVGAINREFGTLAQAGRFATAVVATFWAPTGYLALSNAGHPRPFVYSSRTRQWRIVETRRPPASDGTLEDLPLGVLDDSAYGQFAVRMRPGDVMLIYTDSLIEAKGGDGRQLGEQGLLDVVAGQQTQDGAALARGVYEGVVAKTGCEPEDDATVVVLRCNGVQPRMTFRESLRAQIKFVGMVLGSLRPGGLPAPWPEAKLVNLIGPILPGMNRHPGDGAAEL